MKRGGNWFPIMRPGAEPLTKSSFANFLMAPYSNRIRDGKFSFDGENYRLRFPEKHSIHGDVRDRRWQALSTLPEAVTLEFQSRWHTDFNFPFPISAEVSYALEGGSFTSELVIRNSGTRRMPAGGGFHPYFVKSFPGAGELVELEFEAESIFLYSGNLPLPEGPPAKVPAAYDFKKLRPLPEGLDHGYRGWTGRARFVWPKSEVEVGVRAGNTCRHVIVYSPPGDANFAFEPVSMSTDGFNQMAAGDSETGGRILDPGEELRIPYTLTVTC